jgi:hypothetical protein
VTFHSLVLLQAWVDEFTALHADAGADIRVIVQDAGDGADTGLVEMRMSTAPTVTTIEPESVGADRWVVAFEARESPVRMDSASVQQLSRELALVSELCAFLEAKAGTSD